MTDVLLSDIDGTLVHAEAWRRAFEHFGIEVGMDEAWSQIGDMTGVSLRGPAVFGHNVPEIGSPLVGGWFSGYRGKASSRHG